MLKASLLINNVSCMHKKGVITLSLNLTGTSSTASVAVFILFALMNINTLHDAIHVVFCEVQGVQHCHSNLIITIYCESPCQLQTTTSNEPKINPQAEINKVNDHHAIVDVYKLS